MADSDVRCGGRVIELVEPKRFAMRMCPVPEPRTGEVVVAVRALGLCGTDLHLYAGRATTYPHVVGHDGAGVVAAIGAGLTGVSVGERVTVDPVAHCGGCTQCVAGRPQLCPHGGYLGMLGPGLLAEYVCVPERLVVPLPDEVSDLAATVLEPVAVALHLLDRLRSCVAAPLPCAIVGGGPLGILLGLVLRHHGYQPHVFEPHVVRREIARSLGLPGYPPVACDLGPGPRLVVETSAAAAGVALADELATPGSIVAVVGRAPHSINPASVLLKELTVLGVKGGPRQYPSAVRLVAAGILDPAKVLTHQFGWHQAEQAFELNCEHPEEVVRAALRGPWD